MVDVVDPATRSRMMAGIGGRNTKPELLVRKGLHAKGFRYVLGGAGLPGRPDIVLPGRQVAIFVHGCFWHNHQCHLSKLPGTNRPFWENKLNTNQNRDMIALLSLLSAGWRVATIWECATRGKSAMSKLDPAVDQIARWILSTPADKVLELPVHPETRLSAISTKAQIDSPD
ncbi:MAG: DNA mismatch endonuclease Vsr [Ramlibacter sp.]|nr:DNA mismatch endonuclease Vsr [Ramlibacter sp.]